MFNKMRKSYTLNDLQPLKKRDIPAFAGNRKVRL
jgi:hypothetical protein